VIAQIIQCPLCKCALEWQRLKYWRCPGCSCELWPDENQLKKQRQQQHDKKRAEAKRKQALNMIGTPAAEPLPTVAVVDRKKSRGSNRRGKKKPKPRPRRFWELY